MITILSAFNTVLMRCATTNVVILGWCPFQGRLDLSFRFHIHRTGRVVQDQDLWLHQQGTRDGNSLLLPTGEVDSALLDMRIIAVFQVNDEVVRLGSFRRGNHFFLAGIRLSVTDVVSYVTGK